MLLQPTSPLRTSEDIRGAMEAFVANGLRGVVSISPAHDHPLLIRSVKDGKLEKLLSSSSTCRRQDMPAFYRVNGCIYVNAVSELSVSTSFNDNPIPFIMKNSHSIDIDEPSDLAVASYWLKKGEL